MSRQEEEAFLFDRAGNLGDDAPALSNPDYDREFEFLSERAAALGPPAALRETAITQPVAPPDEYAKAVRAAEHFGIPTTLADTDEGRRQLAQFTEYEDAREARARLQAAPAVKNALLADDDTFKIARDDLDTWEELDRLLHNTKVKFRTGEAMARLGFLEYEEGIVGRQLSPEEAAERDRYRAVLSQGYDPTTDYGLGADIVLNHAEFFGQQWVTQPRAIKTALLGAMLGGLAATTATAGRAPAATLLGTRQGAHAGYVGQSAADTFQIEAGHALAEYRDVRGVDGRELDPEVMKGAAVLAGLVNAGVEVAGIEVLRRVSGISGVLDKVTARKAVRDVVLHNPTVRGALAKLGKATTLATLAEVGEEVMQELSVVASGELAKALSPGEFDSVRAGEVLERVGEIAYKTATGALLFGAGAATPAFAMDVVAAGQAAEQKQFFDALAERSAKSKTRERDPGRYAAALDRLAEDADVDTVYVNAQALVELFQSAGGTLADVQKALPTVAEQLPLALSGNGFVSMSIGDFAANIAGTDAYVALADHVKSREDGFTAAEEKTWRANYQADFEREVEHAVRNAEDVARSEEPADRVYQDVVQKMQAAGMRDTAGAALYRAFYRVMGERSGVDSFELYSANPLGIETEVSRLAAQERVTRLDLSLDKIRKGALPSQRDVFGPSLLEAVRERTGSRDLPVREPTEEGDPDLQALAHQMANEGYLDTPDVDALLAAVERERAGEPVFSPANLNAAVEAEQRDIADLMEVLDELGIDPATATNEEIKAALDGPLADGEPLFQSTTLRTGTENLRKYGIIPGKRYNVRDIAVALERRQREKFGKIEIGDYSEEAEKKIARWIAAEVRFELASPDESGVGWYGKKYQNAIDAFGQLYPELVNEEAINDDTLPGARLLGTVQNARDFFTALVAIASDGEKVSTNFGIASELYRFFRVNGRLPATLSEANKGAGRETSLNINLARVQAYLDKFGPEGMHERLLREDTVKNMRAAARAQGEEFTTDYEGHVMLPYAALVFGSKLGAFYANLMGSHGYLTMDRWWSRAFNRYRGTLLPDVVGLAGSANEFDTKGRKQGLAKFKELYGYADLSDEDALHGPVTAAFLRYKAKGFKNGTAEEKAANTIHKAAFREIRDEPASASDRTFMLRAVARAAANLRRSGAPLSVADIQAVLWYYEKRLYGELQNKRALDISYEEVAKKLVREQGTAGAGDTGGRDLALLTELEGPDGSKFDIDVEAGQEAPAVPTAAGQPAATEDVATAGPSPAPVPLDRLDVGGDAQRDIYGRFGELTGEDTTSSLKFYNLDTLVQNPTRTEDLLRRLGFPSIKYFAFHEDPEAGVTFTIPRLTKDGYDQGTVWIYDPRVAHGSFKDVEYTRQWRIVHEAAHGVTERYMQERYGDSNRYGRLGRPMEGERGKPPKRVKVELRPLTLAEAQRAVEWEDVAFRVQKMLMERLGVVVDPETFAREYNTNISDATYRVITGDFGNPGEYGFVPASTLPNLRNILEILQNTETALAEDQGREPTAGVDLESWTPVSDNDLQAAIDERLDAGQTFFQGGIPSENQADAGRADARGERGPWAGYSRRDEATGVPVDETGRVPLQHWGHTGGLARLEVAHHGTGIPGEEGRRWRENPSKYLPRLYFGVRGDIYAKEPDLGPHHYALSVDPSDIYNIGRDRKLEKFADKVRDRLGRLDLTELEAEIRAAGYKGYYSEAHGVVVYFEDLDTLAYENEQELAQEGARGSIRLSDTPAAPSVITLRQGHDLSTFLHESGHYFLHVFQQTALRADAPPALREEWQNITRWLGSSDPFTPLTREQHEKWAEAFEMYLFEGRAPSEELRGAFAKFRAWLRAIYKALRDIGGFGQLDDEVRGFFDRMLASEEAILAAEARLNARPAVDELARALGLSRSKMERLQTLAVEAREEAIAQVERQLFKEMLRARKAEYREARKRHQEDVETELRATRQYTALDAIGTADSEYKLSRDAIVRTLGSDAILARLPGRGKRSLWRAEGGMAPDAAASLFGYESGEELLLDLAGAPPLREAVKAEVDRRLAEEFGDTLNDGSLGEAAAAAVENHKRAQLLQAELDELTRAGGAALRVPPQKVTREIAERIMGNSKVRHAVKAHVFETAEVRAGKAALRATVEGDYAEAARQKRIQLLNMQLAREARRVAEFEKRALRLARDLQKPRARAKMPKAYLDQIDNILERFEFRPRSDVELERREALADWVKAREAEGLAPAIDPVVLAEGNRTNYRNLTVDELRGVVDALKSISYTGRRHQELLALQEKRRLDELADDLYLRAMNSGLWKDEKPALGKGALDRFAEGLEAWHAEHLKPEVALSALDKHQAGGLWWEAVFRPVAEAEDAEFALMQEVTPQLDALFKLYSRLERATLHIDKRTYRGLGPKNHTLTKAQRLMVALNWGNEDNRVAVLEGYEWSEEGVQEVLDSLDARDWQFVQGVWNLIDSLWPRIAELQRDISGVEPRKVERAPVVTRFGTFDGGYFPLVADPNQSYKAHQREEKQNVAELFGSNFISPQTRKGHTIERRGFGGQPVKLDIDVITQHISNVVHDLTHRRALITVDKIAQHPRVREAIEHTLGTKFYRTLRPWLANIGADQSPPSTQWTRVLSRARHGATVMNMGWKITTMIVQPLGFTQSIDFLGERWAMKGLQFYQNPARNYRFVMERSLYMRNRSKAFDRDVRDITKKVGAGSIRADVDATLFAGIGMLDLSVTLPTWWGAYHKALSELGDETRAIAFAESAVRQSQGAGGAKDLAAIQRNGELHRIFTMFYSYFSSMYNMMARRGSLTRKPADVPRAALSFLYLIALPAVLAELVLGRGPDEDDDESALGWALKTVALYPAQAVVGLRDVVNALDGQGFGYSLTPVADVFRLTADTVRRAASGDEVTESLAKSAWLTASAWYALPGRQLWLTGKYLVDYMSGGVDDFSVYEALVTGDRN